MKRKKNVHKVKYYEVVACSYDLLDLQRRQLAACISGMISFPAKTRGAHVSAAASDGVKALDTVGRAAGARIKMDGCGCV